jgi:hypothetical protein
MNDFHSWTFVLSYLYDNESCKAAAWLWGSTMSADTPSDEMVAFLLRVLENVENAADGPPISALRKSAGSQDEGKPKSVNPISDRGTNPFVERVAAAMSRLRNPAPTRMIG